MLYVQFYFLLPDTNSTRKSDVKVVTIVVSRSHK